MATNNGINGVIPIAIAQGGTNVTSFATSTGIVKYDGSGLVTSSAMKIDSNDRITNTSQPAFVSYQNGDVSNKTGDGTVYTIICDLAPLNQGSNYSTSTGIFTAPIAGKYVFNVGTIPYGSSTGANTLVMQIAATGGTYVLYQGNYTISAYSLNTVISMAANDTAKFQIQVSGGTKTVSLGGKAINLGVTIYQTWFQGYLLC